MKFISVFLCACMLAVSVPFAFAQTAKTFKIETLVGDGKKSKQIDSTLSFTETAFKTSNRKTDAAIKELNYADIKAADYSHAEKPLLSTGGAITSLLIFGVLALPFLFIKKKQHWLSVRTENDYVVMKLDKENFRHVLNEFEIRKVTVTTVDEEAEKKDKK